jgi:hypothetical protein
MKGLFFVLAAVVVCTMVVADDAYATQITWRHHVWVNNPGYPPDVYCGPPVGGTFWSYYHLEVAGERTVWCDGSDTTWGDTSCNYYVVTSTEPCGYGALTTPDELDPIVPAEEACQVAE